jgi:hypothetical protein
MTAEPTLTPQGWTAATVGPVESWYRPLPAGCLQLIDQTIQRLRREPRPTTNVSCSPAERSACAGELAAVLQDLEQGRGFVILEGIPAGRYTSPEMQVLYWLVGQALAEPTEQNVQGTLLYDVRDTGQDLSQGARFSVTSYESSFHTDNSFGETVVDYVGLLCLQTATSGGVNQLVNGHTVYQELRDHHPDALAILCQPFHVDRRGGVRPGQAPTIQFPVIEGQGAGLLFRYLRYWIEAGHQKAGVPLTASQVAALDTLDAVMRRRELWAEFALQPGQILWINNRWLLHNRTAFVDHPQPEQRRHLVRLWLHAR